MSVEIEPGVTLLYGLNGAGKSTFISMLEGLMKPTGGTLKVYGMDPYKEGRKVMEMVAFLPEKPMTFGTSRISDFLYWICTLGNARVEALERLIDRLELRPLLHRNFSDLSVGEQQLISLVAVLSMDRKAYVLDEPNANIDPRRRMEISAIVSEMKKQGKDFLISTHIMDELHAAMDSAAALIGGKLRIFKRKDSIKENKWLSTYISSTDKDIMFGILSDASPRIEGEYVVVDGYSAGEILNKIGPEERSLIISVFSYPRMDLNE